MSSFGGRRKRGPWWLALLAVVAGILAIRAIGRMGGGGSGPEPGTWTAGSDQALTLRADGSAELLEDGVTLGATTTWEPPMLHVHLADGRTISFLHEPPDLSRAGGQHALYRRAEAP